MRFFDQAMHNNNVPEKVTMDKSAVNKAAIDEINLGREIQPKRRVNQSTAFAYSPLMRHNLPEPLWWPEQPWMADDCTCH